MCTAVSLSVSILTGAGKIFDQDSWEDPNDTVELSLPEAIVLMGLSAQDADDSAFGKRQLVFCLSCIVVQGLRKGHCSNKEGKAQKTDTE